MLVRRSGLLIAVVVLLEGCVGSGAPVRKIDGLSPEARQAVLGLPIYQEGELTGKEHTVVNMVEGTSCKYRRGDPDATETDAIDEAKYWAKDKGAEGIKKLKTAPPRGKTFFRKCWESITCSGQAIKFAK